MIDVKSEYGAMGDGKADDTRAIQKALDVRCDGATPKAIFFPAGTYRVTETLYLSHHSGGKCRRAGPYGGWIAGAGSGATVIRMDPGLKKGVFASDGLASATIQGLTFQTFAYRPGDPPAHNFEMSSAPATPRASSTLSSTSSSTAASAGSRSASSIRRGASAHRS